MRTPFTPLRIAAVAVITGLGSTATAQVKIGDNPTAIQPGSVLELESTNKALRITRVSLSTTTDQATVPTPATGMVVFNTNPSISSSNVNFPANGVGVYYWDGNGWVFSGVGTLGNNFWSLNGNSNASDGVNFLGTLNNQALNFRVGNQRAGRISIPTEGNTTFGALAGDQAVTLVPQSNNTLIGTEAGSGVTTGKDNTALGYRALQNVQNGSKNTGVGYRAGGVGVGDSANTFLGYEADVTAPSLGIDSATAIGVGAKVGQSNSVILGNQGARVGVGVTAPNSKLHVAGNMVGGFPFGSSIFYTGIYSRPNRPNNAASEISYGVLSHANADAIGTYNAVAGRILRTGDTSAANLTAALGHVNNPGNFQTAVLGITNSRANQSGDGQVFSGLRVTSGIDTATLNATQKANTYAIYSTSPSPSVMTGRLGVGTLAPTNQMHVASGADPLRLEGLQTGTSGDSLLSVDAATGVVRRVAINTTGAVTTASNGLTKTGNDIALGGTLNQNTTIATAGNNLNLTGTGDLIVDDSVKAGRLGVTNNATIGGNTTTGTLNSGNASIAGTLGATGATTLGSTLNVTGTSTTNGINNTGTLNNTGDLNVIGGNATTLSGTLGVTGNTTVTSLTATALPTGAVGNDVVTIDAGNVVRRVPSTTLTGVIRASNGLTRDADSIELGGTLNQNTTIATAGNNLNLTGTGDLIVDDSVKAGRLGVTNNATIGGNTTTGTLNSGNASIAGTLGATGATTLGSTLNVTGNTTVTTLTATGLQNGASTDSILTIQPGGVVRRVDLNTIGGLTTASNGLTKVGNDIRLGGTLNTATTIAQAGNQLNLSGGTVNISDSLYAGRARVNTDLAVGNNSTVGGNSTVSGNSTVGGNASIAGTLGVTGATTLSSTLNVAGTTTLFAPVGASTDSILTQDPVTGTVRRVAINTTGAITTASNGLTKVGNDVRLGGTLTGTTNIDNGTFFLNLNGIGGGLNVSNQLNALNAQINNNLAVSNGLTVSGSAQVNGGVTAGSFTTTGNTNTGRIFLNNTLASTSTTDSLLNVVPGTNEVRKVGVGTILSNIRANNGLNRDGDSIQLGGPLTEPTVITSSAANTIAIAGLQAGTAADSVVVIDPATGVLRRSSLNTLGGVTTASNGLTKVGNDIRLGGTLNQATTITQAGNQLNLNGGTVAVSDSLYAGRARVNNNLSVGGNTTTGTLNAGTSSLGNTTVAGTVSASGLASLNGGASIGNGATIGGGVTVNGGSTLNGGITATGLPAGTVNDSVLTIDGGVVRRVPRSAITDVIRASNGLNRDGDTIQLGGTLNEATTINTDRNSTLTIQANGIGSIGNNNVEANQGLNVLATTADGAARAVALRGRIAQTTGTVDQARGVSGAATISGGSVTGTATGGYFNTNIRDNATLGSGVAVTGLAADAEVLTGLATPLGAGNTLMGARFGAFAPTATPTAARTVGVQGQAYNSSTNNIGVLGAANTSDAQVTSALGALAPAQSVGVMAINAGTNPATDRALYTNGRVEMVGTPAGTLNDSVLTIDPATNVVRRIPRTAITGVIRANNGLTRDGDSIELGGTLNQATTITQAGNQLNLSGGTVAVSDSLYAGSTRVNTNLVVGGNTNTGTLNAGNTSIAGTLGATGATTLNSTLDVTGNTTVTTLTATGLPAGTVNDTIVTIQNNVVRRVPRQTITDVIRASNGLTRDGDTIELGGTLNQTTTITTAGNDLNIIGTGNLNVTDSVVAGNLITAGNIRAGGSLGVLGSSVLSGGATISNTNPGGTGLTVNNASVLNGGVRVTGLANSTLNDSVVVADPATGELRRVSPARITNVIRGANGLTRVGDSILLGGTLFQSTNINTANNTFTLGGGGTINFNNPTNIGANTNITGNLQVLAGNSTTLSGTLTVGGTTTLTALNGAGTRMVVAGPTGVLNTLPIPNDSTIARNGLTQIDDTVELGGTLIRATTIVANAANTLRISGTGGLIADTLTGVDSADIARLNVTDSATLNTLTATGIVASTDSTDDLLNITAAGEVRRISPSVITSVIKAGNGLTRDGDTIELGGTLNMPTIVAANGTNTLRISGTGGLIADTLTGVDSADIARLNVTDSTTLNTLTATGIAASTDSTDDLLNITAAGEVRRISPSVITSVIKASNGLTRDGDTIELGGMLNIATTIDKNGNDLNLTRGGTLAVTDSSTTDALAVSAAAIGDPAARSIGVLGTANATPAQTAAFVGTLPANFAGAVVGFNPNSGDNNYAGNFVGTNNSTNGRVLNVLNTPAANTLTAGDAPFTTENTMNYGGTESSGIVLGSVGSMHAVANSSTSDYQVQGVLAEAQTSGAVGGGVKAASVYGVTRADGPGVDSSSVVVGVAAATNFADGSSTWSGIAFDGFTGAGPIGATLGRTAGANLEGFGGTTNFGVIGTLDNSTYQTFFDPSLSNKHIGVVGANRLANDTNNYGLYTIGGVRMTELNGIPSSTQVLAIDSFGDVRRLPTASITDIISAGNGLNRDVDTIKLGGPLTQNTTITGGDFNTTINSTNGNAFSSALRVDHAPGTLPAGREIFGGVATATATGSGTPGVDAVVTIRAQVNQAFGSGNNTRVHGSLNEAQAFGTGLGAVGVGIPQATGVTGLADYKSTTNAPATDFLVGVRGAAYTDGGRTNGLNVVGMNFGGQYYRSVGGYFRPTNGNDANLGVVSQVGGTENQGWRDGALAGRSIAVSALNYGAGVNDRAIYSQGAVQLRGLTDTASIDSVLGIQPSGDVRRVATSSLIGALKAGNGITKTQPDSISLGGTLQAATTILANGTNTLRIAGNGGLIADTLTGVDSADIARLNVTDSTTLNTLTATGIAASADSTDDLLNITAAGEVRRTTPSAILSQLKAGNGLTKTQPDSVSLGGQLSAPTTINTNTFAFNITGNGGGNLLNVTIPTTINSSLNVTGNASVGGTITSGSLLLPVGASRPVIANGTGTAGTLALGPAVYSATAVLAFTAVPDGGFQDQPFTDLNLVGAAIGDAVTLGIPHSTANPLPANSHYFAWVSAANTVTVRFFNRSGSIQSTSGTFKVKVMQ